MEGQKTIYRNVHIIFVLSEFIPRGNEQDKVMTNRFSHNQKSNLMKNKIKADVEITSPRSLPSVPSKSITRVQGSIPAHFANQIPFVV